MKAKSRDTICVRTRFFTTDLKDPKTAWADNGYLQIEANPSRGIKAGKPVFFKTLDALTVTLDKLLRQKGVTLIYDIDRGKPIPRLGANY